MAVCVAVIGKDNGPLFFKCRRKAEDGSSTGGQITSSSDIVRSGADGPDLQYSFIVSSALDIIDERVQLGSSGAHQAFKGNTSLGTSVVGGAGSGDGSQVTTRELYLGALTAQEEYKVYGYMTNTKIKFVIIVEETSIPLRENDIRMMFRKLHEAFCDLMSNPFYLPGTEISSKRFETAVSSIMAGQ